MEIGQMRNCKNNWITEKSPAGAVMDHVFCWVETDLLKTLGDKLNEHFIPFTLSSLSLFKVRFDCSLIITL